MEGLHPKSQSRGKTQPGQPQAGLRSGSGLQTCVKDKAPREGIREEGRNKRTHCDHNFFKHDVEINSFKD